MKMYPPKNRIGHDHSFTETELKRGIWKLYCDVTCEDCKKVHAYANATNGVWCIACGGRCS